MLSNVSKLKKKCLCFVGHAGDSIIQISLVHNVLEIYITASVAWYSNIQVKSTFISIADLKG